MQGALMQKNDMNIESNKTMQLTASDRVYVFKVTELFVIT